MNNYWIDIHEPGQDAVRSVRISGVARVGRGAICEIQLRAPRIGMIECVLRHQAGRWQLCPLPGSTQARVGSADVTATTTIERDVPFQIGAFQLCLREAANGQVAQPGSRSSPLEARWSARKADRPPTPTTASSNRVEAPKPGLPQRPYTAPTRRS